MSYFCIKNLIVISLSKKISGFITGIGLGSLLSELEIQDESIQIQIQAFYKHMHEDLAALEGDPCQFSLQQLFDEVNSKV